MKVKVKIKTETEIELDLKTVAAWFAGLDDEAQAQFIIEVAEVAKTWERHQSGQWWLVGRHIRTCKCSTIEARGLIESVHDGIVYEEDRW